MPRPTTRAGRFEFYRQKHLAKAKVERERRFTTSRRPDGTLVRTKNPFYYERLGRLKAPDLSKETFSAFYPETTVPSPGISSINKIGYGSPPHPKFLAYPPPGSPYSWWYKSFGSVVYFRKPVQRLGRRVGHLNKDQFLLWAAALTHFLNGYWPMNDPLSRHPNEEEVFREEEPLPQDPVGSWV